MASRSLARGVERASWPRSVGDTAHGVLVMHRSSEDRRQRAGRTPAIASLYTITRAAAETASIACYLAEPGAATARMFRPVSPTRLGGAKRSSRRQAAKHELIAQAEPPDRSRAEHGYLFRDVCSCVARIGLDAARGRPVDFVRLN